MREHAVFLGLPNPPDSIPFDVVKHYTELISRKKKEIECLKVQFVKRRTKYRRTLGKWTGERVKFRELLKKIRAQTRYYKKKLALDYKMPRETGPETEDLLKKILASKMTDAMKTKEFLTVYRMVDMKISTDGDVLLDGYGDESNGAAN